MKIHRDRRATTSGRQRTARRFAVGRRWRLGASSALAGLPGPAGGEFGAAPSPGRRDGGPKLLPSRHLRPITTTSGAEAKPKC
jgi:hypothetical protein